MRLAYYISLHHKIYQFEWLLKAIHRPDDVFFIRIDSKSGPGVLAQVTSLVQALPNVVVLPPMQINWGGWSQVASELDAMDVALRTGEDWDYFINLSGQDYPIKSRDKILSTLEQSYPLNHIRVWSFEDVRGDEPNDPHLKERVSVEAFGRVRTLPVRWSLRNPERRYKGSGWHTLSHEFCEWILESKEARSLTRRMRHTVCPDETYFQVALMASPFRDRRTPDCGRYFEFPGPKVLRMDDLPSLLRPDNLFARKFDSSVDQAVLFELAARHGYAVPRSAITH